MAVIFVISYNVTLLNGNVGIGAPGKPQYKSKKKWWEVYGEKKGDFKEQVKNVIEEDKRFTTKEEPPTTDVKNKEIGRGSVSGK